MFPNGHNIKWIQLQSKHGICPKLGALVKYFQFISMNKSIANWNYLFAGIKLGLIQQSTSTSSQSYSHSKSGFFFFIFLFYYYFFLRKGLEKEKNHHHSCLMNKSSSSSLFDHKQISIFKGKISKTIFNGKISMNKSSKGKISKTIFQRKNLHEQIFIKIFSKVQSPE